MIRTSFHIPQRTLARLQRLSEATGLPQAEHVRRALDEYLQRQERENKTEEDA